MQVILRTSWACLHSESRSKKKHSSSAASKEKQSTLFRASSGWLSDARIISARRATAARASLTTIPHQSAPGTMENGSAVCREVATSGAHQEQARAAQLYPAGGRQLLSVAPMCVALMDWRLGWQLALL